MAQRLSGVDEFRASIPAAEFLSAAGPEFAVALLYVNTDTDDHKLSAWIGDRRQNFLAFVTLLERRAQRDPSSSHATSLR